LDIISKEQVECFDGKHFVGNAGIGHEFEKGAERNDYLAHTPKAQEKRYSYLPLEILKLLITHDLKTRVMDQ
jgi:hypothetical protein